METDPARQFTALRRIDRGNNSENKSPGPWVRAFSCVPRGNALNMTVIFYGSFLAIPAGCWWLARAARRTLPGPQGLTLHRALHLYLIPLGLYALLVAASAASCIDGQWTWLGETIKATPFQDFQNNLFLVGSVSLYFPAGYGGLGLAVLIYSALSTRELAAGIESRKKTRN